MSLIDVDENDLLDSSKKSPSESQYLLKHILCKIQ